MNKKVKQRLIVLLGILLGSALIYGVFKKIPVLEVIDSFRNATPQAIWGFLGVSILIMIVHTLRWDVILKADKHKIPFLRLFMYKIVGFGISFITPAAKVGGEPIRAALTQRHGISFKKSFSTIVIDKIIDLSTTGILFAIAVAIAIFTFSFPKSMVIIMIGSSAIFITLIIYVYYQIMNNKNLFLKVFRFLRLHKIKKLQNTEKKIVDFERMIVIFHNEKKKAFYKAIVLSAIAWILMFFEYTLALAIFGITGVSLQGIFLIITMMGIAYMFPVPLALGVLEAGQISMFKVLGLSTAAGVGLSMVIRFRDLGWTLIAVIILAGHGFNFKKAYDKTIQEGRLKLPKDEKEEKLIKETFK